MQDKDRVSIKYFEEKARFADLLNGYFFQGEAVVQAEDIQERKREIVIRQKDIEKKKYRVLTRDITKEVKLNMNVVFLAVESQSKVHYAMPVKILAADGGFYYSQWKQLAAEHEEKRDLKNAEFLSGISKEERLKPTITIVLYFGNEPWDGPRSLKDMLDMEHMPEIIQRYIGDYPMCLLEVRRYEEYEKFKTDLRYVFGYLQKSQNKEELKQYIKDNHAVFECIREDAYDLMITMSHSKELKVVKLKYQNAEGEVNMCKAIQEMIEDGREEGRCEGRREGRQEGRHEGHRDGYQEGIRLTKKIMRLKMENKTDSEIAEECEISLERVVWILEQ